MMEKEERTMVFIDLRNVMGILRRFDVRAKIDFTDMVEHVTAGRRQIAAYVFDGEGDGDGKKFHDALEYSGFRVITRNAYDPLDNKQKEVDSAMVCKMVEHAFRDNYDTAIIISGDRDFCPAVELIQSLGKRVEVAGFSMTMSGALHRSGDVYHDMDALELFYDVTRDHPFVDYAAGETVEICI